MVHAVCTTIAIKVHAYTQLLNCPRSKFRRRNFLCFVPSLSPNPRIIFLVCNFPPFKKRLKACCVVCAIQEESTIKFYNKQQKRVFYNFHHFIPTLALLLYFSLNPTIAILLGECRCVKNHQSVGFLFKKKESEKKIAFEKFNF